MTFHQLLNTDDIDIWTATNDEELTKILQPYFFVTRPTKEQLAKAKDGTSSATVSTKGPKKPSFENLQKDLFALAAARGIVLPPGTPIPK